MTAIQKTNPRPIGLLRYGRVIMIRANREV